MFQSAANILDNASEQVCRLCLVEEEDLVYIFNPKGYHGFKLWITIEELLQEEVYKEDGLPWTICKGCVSKLKDYKHFKSTCIKAKISFFSMRVSRGSEFIVKDEVDEGESLSKAETHDQEIFCKNEPACTGVSKDSSLTDPLYLIDIKEDADEVESCSEADTYTQDNQQEYASLDAQVLNVVCLSPVKEELCWDKGEVDPRETLAREDTHGGGNLVEDVTRVTSVSNHVSEPELVENMCGDKEENDSSVSLAGEETQCVEDLNESGLISVASVISVPPSVENVVDDYLIAVKNPKEGVNICAIIGERNEVTLKRNTHLSRVSQGQKARQSSTTPSTTKQCDMKKKRSAKCKNRFKSGNYNVSTFEGYDRRLLCDREKISSNYSEYVCDYCGMKHTDKKNLQLHITGHDSNNKMSICVTSGKMSLMWSELNTPRNRGSALYKCEKCGKNYKTKKNLSTHIMVHCGVRPFKCETCGNMFSHKGNFRIHKLIHSDLRPFKCETCFKVFARKGDLKRHAIIHSGLRPFKCVTCWKEFTQKGDLRRHAIIHSGLRPFKCVTCEKEFYNKSNLLKHTMIHIGVKPFRCETCGKEFTQKGTLRKHAIIHSGFRPFKCDTCSKEFYNKSNLLRHTMIHNGVKPFMCETCGKEFNQKSTLRGHAIIHSGLRPFKCVTCGKDFYNKSNLLKHTMIHNGVKPFKCETCGKEFTQKGTLKKHNLAQCFQTDQK